MEKRCKTSSRRPRVRSASERRQLTPYLIVTTGIINEFPINKIGHHSKDSFKSVLDRIMSTYSSSVKAFIPGRQRSIVLLVSIQVLLVATKHTLGNFSLAGPANSKIGSFRREYPPYERLPAGGVASRCWPPNYSSLAELLSRKQDNTLCLCPSRS